MQAALRLRKKWQHKKPNQTFISLSNKNNQETSLLICKLKLSPVLNQITKVSSSIEIILQSSKILFQDQTHSGSP